MLNGGRPGWVDWFVRLQTTPGAADAIADALARRPDTRWVNLASGGTEITSLQARTPEHRNDLFLRGLPGSRRASPRGCPACQESGPWRPPPSSAGSSRPAPLTGPGYRVSAATPRLSLAPPMSAFWPSR